MLLNQSLLENQVLFRIEKSDMNTNSVLLDFIDSEYFSIFNTLLGTSYADEGPCLLLFQNYFGRSVREGSMVAIDRDVLRRLLEQQRFTFIEDSAIILAEVNLEGKENLEIFIRPAIDNYLSREIRLNQYFDSPANPSSLSLSSKVIDQLIVKKIGQGSWNEIQSATNTKIVFDFGTHYNTRFPALKAYLGNTESRYQNSNPSLIISHWDVDHYHFLKALSDTTIASFSNIICRNKFPSKLSQSLYTRIRRLNTNFYLINPGPKGLRHRPPPLYELYRNGSFILFNSGMTSSSNMNSLSALIRKKKVSALLTADQHYDQFDTYVLQKYLNYRHRHNLIVPHHGGYAGNYIYNIPHRVILKDAVISVGKNTYGHPIRRNVNQLTYEGFSIVNMKNQASDHVITL